MNQEVKPYSTVKARIVLCIIAFSILGIIGYIGFTASLANINSGPSNAEIALIILWLIVFLVTYNVLYQYQEKRRKQQGY